LQLKKAIAEGEVIKDEDADFYLLQVEASINSRVSGGIQLYFLAFIN
jgi:hypothetical protein